MGTYNAQEMMDILKYYHETKPSFAEDALEAPKQAYQHMIAMNTESQYQKFKDFLINDPETTELGLEFSDVFIAVENVPIPILSNELTEILACVTPAKGSSHTSPNMILLESLSMNDAEKDFIAKLIKESYYLRKYNRAKQYMNLSADIPKALPLFDLDNPDDLNYLYTVMFKCVMYSDVEKTLERIIFEAFDAVGTKRAYEIYMERLEAYRKGDNPSFSCDMQKLGILYALNWFRAEQLNVRDLSEMDEIYYCKYLQENSLLRTGLSALGTFYFCQSNPLLFTVLLSLSRILNNNILIDPLETSSFLQLVFSFISTFGAELVKESPELEGGSQLVIAVCEIISQSLLVGTKYNSWLDNFNTTKWWQGDYHF